MTEKESKRERERKGERERERERERDLSQQSSADTCSIAKEPYKRDNILQKRPIISSILLTVATPYAVSLHCVA